MASICQPEHAGLHGCYGSLDGAHHGLEAALHRRGRLALAGGQEVHHALDVGAVVVLLDAEIEVQQVPRLDDQLGRPGVADGRTRGRR